MVCVTRVRVCVRVLVKVCATRVRVCVRVHCTSAQCTCKTLRVRVRVKVCATTCRVYESSVHVQFTFTSVRVRVFVH